MSKAYPETYRSRGGDNAAATEVRLTDGFIVAPRAGPGDIDEGRGDSSKCEFVVDGSRVNLTQGLRDIWAYREVIWSFAERNVRVKYKQAALGVAWAVIQPLSFLTIFTIVFARAFGSSSSGVSYPASALSALVPWMFLQTALTFGAQALFNDGALLRKVYFAREAPVLGAVASSCIDFAIGLGLLLVLGPFLGMRITWAVLLAIPLACVLVVLASGIAMALGALSVYYRDFRYALPVLIQLWMFASPVAYPLSVVPDRWKGLYILANPAAGILEGFRRALAEGGVPDVRLVGVGVVETVAIAWTGYLLFKRMELGFADAI